jgi:hypothetical protein
VERSEKPHLTETIMLQYSELKAKAAQLDERFTDFWRRL